MTLPSATVSLEGDWDAWMEVVDPARFGRAIEQEMRKATIDNCRYLIMKIKKAINSRRYKANAPLTILLKGSDLPLADHGDLMKYLTYKLQTAYEALVGVKKSSGAVNIAEVLHDGATIRMTRKMKRWIAIAMTKELGKKGAAKAGFGGSTGVINIPGRPFLDKVLQNGHVQARIRRRWAQAYEYALTGSVKK